MGDPTMYDFITRFGFGIRTGIELPVRPPVWSPPQALAALVDRLSRHRAGSGLTPLQIAAFGALANDGVRIAPPT